MQVWRLSRPEFARRLDGGGNRETGARWNSPGAGVVYTSRSLALCVLETIVHLPSIRFVQGLVAARIDVPDDAGAEVVSAAEMPDDPFARRPPRGFAGAAISGSRPARRWRWSRHR